MLLACVTTQISADCFMLVFLDDGLKTRDENMAWNNSRPSRYLRGIYSINSQGKYKMRADLRDRNNRIACLEADVEIPGYLSFLCRVAHKASSICSPKNMISSGATRTSLLHPAIFLSFFAALLNAVFGGYRWEGTPREVAAIRSGPNTFKGSLESREHNKMMNEKGIVSIVDFDNIENIKI